MTSAPCLLLLACSQRKRPNPDLLPAIDRYDGVNYRVLRKALREHKIADSLRIFILSAKFGLIDAFEPIPNYDQKMTLLRANELCPLVSSQLDAILAEQPWRLIFVNLGKIYVAALADSKMLPRAENVHVASGGIGQRAGQLKTWLRTLSE